MLWRGSTSTVIPLDKKDYTKPDCMDIQWEDKVYHGNYQGCKSDTAVIKYCTKDGKFIASKDIADLTNKNECRTGKSALSAKSLCGCLM